ncbi:DIL and Ankyrin domain-containing protein [Histoplasma capsulatum G186AR]|uniref:DIL and Ankyrin domain-containing protein n=2 Tax=Ajellomyces capsulatus TaxID=5037 RepID=C0NL80_AJECG|nr:DIL and Ankyrin domain-containing protein [Histoplasma capsulatum G186AR]EEH08621.1 DIL and Ankyrin domain-containing protein [Histoplasma capsulatum G186AR]KAG5299059.1 DIL and Ankyrin domain-containing protein [Histoplasma capsulatum]QSS68321.1 DIL and Ankyrin domain-containing protein [Histoplasma capsulatum G186AR]
MDASEPRLAEERLGFNGRITEGAGKLDYHDDGDDGEGENDTAPKPRQLPDDLPTSLDDRRSVPTFGPETEIYDAWQGQSHFLTNPIPAKPLSFNLALDDGSHDEEYGVHSRYTHNYYLDDGDSTTRAEAKDSDARLMEMLAAQAAHREVESVGVDEDDIATDDKMSYEEKRDVLQRSLNMAASNGDVERVRKLVGGKARQYVDVNTPDEEGTVPLIYASCFGHQEVVSALLEAGANVDKQDRNRWSALMWAMTNRHKTIAKILLDYGASPDIKSSSGGTAFDFAQPGTDISKYLQENGYHFGASVAAGDYYDFGFSHNRFEEEMAENEMKRRMMMEESAINLEVDLSSLGLDEKLELPDDFEDQQEFVWDRCLNDQMFVFQENELERILDIVITNMTPQRSPSQKPVPANLLFLSARYAHYHAGPELLAKLLISAMGRINEVVEKHQWDMTILAFWISNATLLLHYLKKDGGLVEATAGFQRHLAELIHEIFILIIRDAERRMDKVLDTAMLDHETIPGFEDVHFQNEWNLFRSRTKVKPEPLEKSLRPPSPKRRAQVSPRNITSLLSSTLFVLDLYDVHSIITTQILAQLLYWLGVELFNRIMTTRRYLARTKAMQIRMNVSALEDWARNNNRQPEHYENGSTLCSGETTVDSARKYLAPVIQLLQWLQCFSSLGDDTDSLTMTLQQLQQLTPSQLLHAVRHYRPEVGEKGLPKAAMKYLLEVRKEPSLLAQIHHPQSPRTQREEKVLPRLPPAADSKSTPQTTTNTHPSDDKPLRTISADGGSAADPPTQYPTNNHQSANAITQSPPSSSPPGPPSVYSLKPDPGTILLNPTSTLPFSLPTNTDMLVSYGAGFGGVNRERARKYIPTVPTEFLNKFDRGES